LFTRQDTGQQVNGGDGVVSYLIDQLERSERKRIVLVALMRFKNAVHTHDGTEEEKIAAAQLHHPRPPSMPISSCFACKAKRRPTRRLHSCVCNTQTYFCNNKMPARRLEEAQGRVQTGAQTQEA